MSKDRVTRRQVLRSAVGAAALAVGMGAGLDAVAATRKRRPNLVFILIDDQAWNAMGHCGRFPFLSTPNMDRLAREGARFENVFVTTSLCSPSRACFLSGCHAHRHGVRTNARRDPERGIQTFPQALQEAGYDTAFVGKWHMAPTANPRPGFNYWLSFRGQGKYTNPALNENGRDFVQEGYMTDLLCDYAVNWLKQAREKPFCLLLWHKAVHGPFTPAPRHADAFPDAALPKPPNFDDTFEGKPKWFRRMKAYGARTAQVVESRDKETPESFPPVEWNGRQKHHLDYLRALLAVDEGIGAVLDTLEEMSELDNTVVVFSSDNGFFLGEHRCGDKRLAYEESIRIPLLVRYPGVVKPGTRLGQMALSIDVAPTLLDLADVRAPRSMQGRSLVPLLKGKKASWRDSFLYAYYREDWVPGLPTMFAVRTERWKYIHCPDVPGDIDELYDLENDPHELRNLAIDPAHKDRLAEMEAELKRLLKQAKYKEPEPPKPVKVPLSLALHYTFDNIEGGTVHDKSGNNLHGVVHGVEVAEGRRGKALSFDGKGFVEVPGSSKQFSPAHKPFAVGAWCRPASGDGVIISFGGQSHGFSLYLRGGVPHFAVMAGDAQAVVLVSRSVPLDKWVHLLGELTSNSRLCLYVDGQLAGETKALGFIPVKPNEGCTVGADLHTLVGDYPAPLHWQGLIDEVRLYWGELGDRKLRRWLKE